MTEKTEITGTLDRIIYSASESDFIIASFNSTTGRFSALGTMPNAQPGMEYTLTGQWEEKPPHGLQFKFSLYHLIEPSDARGIFNYLVRVCKFVGPTTGNVIIDLYGDQALDVLKENPERFAGDVNGITLDRAYEIQTELLKHAEYEAVAVKLEALLDVPGMRKSLLTDLLQEYKHEAADKVISNPYILTTFHGIGFAMADKVAVLNVGFPRDSIERKKAAAVHALKEINQGGHVWADREALVNKIYELIQIKNLDDGVAALLVDGTFTESSGDIAFASMADEEKKTAIMLMALRRVAA